MSGYAGETEHTCACGHVRDEHDGECTVVDCPCLAFDRIPDGEQAAPFTRAAERAKHPLGRCCIAGRCDGEGCDCACHPGNPDPDA